MNEPKNEPQEKPPSLGNTLFLSGLCVVMGGVVFLIGIGALPSGAAEPSASGSLLAIGSGLLFVFAGFMILVRDLAGAKNGEDLPANAPAFLRFSASILNVLLLAVFASVASIVALGTLPGLERQLGGIGLLFRIFVGAFALLLWYGAIYLAITKLRKDSS